MGIILWPFRFVWSLIGFLFGVLGKLLSAVIALVLIIVGIALTVTIVGAFAGIPCILIGLLLLLRSIF